MANANHLELLLQGVDALNAGRAKEPSGKPDFSEADLRGVDLRRADLHAANLRMANLREADLRGADLSGADLSEANLMRANLRGADLHAANLRGADLTKADLTEAVLGKANLRKANLSGANLRGADLRETDLRDADLSWALLVRTNFSAARLRGANFGMARLPMEYLSAVRLDEPDFRGGDFSRAEFTHASAIEPDFAPSADKLDALRISVPPNANWHDKRPRAALQPSEMKGELLDVSAFSPSEVAQGKVALVQFYFHKPTAAAVAAALAKESDPDAVRRGITTLLVETSIGQRIDIALEVTGAKIDPPTQYLIWRGAPRSCQFELTAGLKASSVVVRAIIAVDGAPAGSLRFRVAVLDKDAPQTESIKMTGESARRYGRAFLCYASPDRAEVLKRAQALKAARITFFQDLLSLEPGQRWEKRLYEEIDRCDLFLLFWSSHAKASRWVIAETERALACHAGMEDAPPDIVPIVLEGPPVPAPPDALKDIHFNDWLRYVIAAEEANDRGTTQ